MIKLARKIVSLVERKRFWILCATACNKREKV
jgi:hypothetical protein